jgi:hypothetical protein
MYEEIIYQVMLKNMEEDHEFTPVQKLGAKLSLDGDQYCWLLGENLQEGIAGFGNTPYEAMIAFNDVFYNKRATRNV